MCIRDRVKSRIVSLYQDFEYLLENEKLMESEKMAYRHILTEMAEMDDVNACDSLNYLCRYLEHAYGKKVIILLDEYDTPKMCIRDRDKYDEKVFEKASPTIF